MVVCELICTYSYSWLAINSACRVKSRVSAGNPGGRPPGPETGRYEKAPQWLHPPGGLSLSAVLAFRGLGQVVAAFLDVRQECGEDVAADDVRAALGPLAVPDGGHAVQVGRDLDAASVVRTAAGLPP